MKRLRLLLLVSAVCCVSVTACGGSSKEATAGGGNEDRRHFGTDSSTFVEAQRGQSIPTTNDAAERILFLKSGSVWLMHPDGSEPTQLTVRPLDAPDAHPVLSPSGLSIAYSSPSKQGRKIFVMSLEEQIPEMITDGKGGDDWFPAWSPDGKRIAFIRGEDRRDLYIVSAIVAVRPVLLLEGNDDNPEFVGHPTWSPSGDSIVISADRRQGNGTVLWHVNASNGALSQLTPTKRKAVHVTDLDAAYSPDGKSVAFASNRHVSSADDAGDLDIYSIHIDGSGLTRLTSDTALARYPSFSPDGKRLFFVSTRDRQRAFESEIWVMAATGGEQKRVTRDERPQNSQPFAGRLANP